MRIQPFRAVVLLLGLAFCQLAAAEEVAITEEARAHFRAGVNFMQDPDGARYEEAYREFEIAYAASPSWKILGNLGICAMKLERDGEAIEAFERYLAEGGAELSADERAQFERDLETLRTGVVQVTLDSVPPRATVVDRRIPVRGDPVTNRYRLGTEPLTLGIRSGHHEITARLDGYQDQTWEIDAVSGSTMSHTFELEPLAPQTPAAVPGAPGSPAEGEASGVHRPLTTGVYVGMALTGALAVGGGVMGALALSKNGDYDEANDGSDVEGARSLRDSVGTYNLVTDALLGAAVVSAAVTTYLYVSRPEVPIGGEAGRARLVPLVGRDAGGLLLSGTF